MANRIVRRSEAMAYCLSEGYQKFIDIAISDRIVILEDLPLTVEQKFANALLSNGYRIDDATAIMKVYQSIEK